MCPNEEVANRMQMLTQQEKQPVLPPSVHSPASGRSFWDQNLQLSGGMHMCLSALPQKGLCSILSNLHLNRQLCNSSDSRKGLRAIENHCRSSDQYITQTALLGSISQVEAAFKRYLMIMQDAISSRGISDRRSPVYLGLPCRQGT